MCEFRTGEVISTTHRTINQTVQNKLHNQTDEYRNKSKRFVKHNRKRLVRYGILTSNVALLVIVLTFVVKSSPAQNSIVQPETISNGKALATAPVDQLSSADIAVHVARLTGLPESTAVINYADTINVQLTVATANDSVIAKPQVVSTDLKSRHDIIEYAVQPGETVATLSSKFNVTSDTIRWSNGLSGDSIPAGKVIFVLPGVNGIIHRAVAGDTPESLASRFQGNKDQIVAYNDAEDGLPIGAYVIIPGGLPISNSRSSRTAGVTGGYSSGFSAVYGYNGYDPGWCTWYAASRVAVPNNWGNANTWDNYAALSGWVVSPVPRPGAIGQSNAGWAGHVGIVEAVSPDGTMIKYSDMNGLAGFGRVGYSDWAPASRFNNYIYR